MATIYRFIVEEGKSAKGGARKGGGGNSKTKSGKSTSLLKMLSGNKGGVEANRKMRAINPLINKMTFGYWEKATRLGRASMGLVKFKETENGTLKYAGLSGSAVAIIIALAIATYLKIQNISISKNEKENSMNFKKLEVGQTQNHGNYKTSVNLWNGHINYNQNK